jgi:hypothetical protein
MTQESTENELKVLALITDILIRLTALEKVLLAKNIIISEEMAEEVIKLSKITEEALVKNLSSKDDKDTASESLQGN